MDETKVQIGGDVLLDIGTHSNWYISSIGYDGESVDVALRRKADRNIEPQTCDDCIWSVCNYNKVFDLMNEPRTCSVNGRPYTECSECEHFKCTADEPQTERSSK